MREIKFRGRRIDNGEWVYGYLSFIYVDGKDKNGFIYTDKAKIYCQDESKSYDVATKSIGQFTGLLDKNGKEIYESDIIKTYDVKPKRTEDFGGKIFVIKFLQGSFECLRDWNGYNEIEQLGILCSYHGMVEVIGNIYENKELIK